jgi:hypothetical protein
MPLIPLDVALERKKQSPVRCNQPTQTRVTPVENPVSPQSQAQDQSITHNISKSSLAALAVIFAPQTIKDTVIAIKDTVVGITSAQAIRDTLGATQDAAIAIKDTVVSIASSQVIRDTLGATQNATIAMKETTVEYVKETVSLVRNQTNTFFSPVITPGRFYGEYVAPSPYEQMISSVWNGMAAETGVSLMGYPVTVGGALLGLTATIATTAIAAKLWPRRTKSPTV